jgi:hypothetical protein
MLIVAKIGKVSETKIKFFTVHVLGVCLGDGGGGGGGRCVSPLFLGFLIVDGGEYEK